VVTRDVAPYAVVAGVPAREIRRRFDTETIRELETIRWWEWPDEIILARMDWFYRPVQEFITEFGHAR